MITKGGCGFPKCLLVLVNLFFLVFGVGITIFSIIFLLNPSLLVNMTMHWNINDTQIFLSKNFPQQYALWALAIGPAFILLSLFGCCGSILIQPCLLITYTIIIIIAILLEITSGYALVFYQREADSMLRNWFVNSIKYDYENSSTPQIWDNVFTNFNCCGVNNAEDFKYSSFHNKTNFVIPSSCCYPLNGTGSTINEQKCPSYIKIDSSVYSKGCFEVVIEILLSYRNIIGGTLIGIATIELLTIIAAVLLIKFQISRKVA